jgi:hypothetical protein
MRKDVLLCVSLVFNLKNETVPQMIELCLSSSVFAAAWIDHVLNWSGQKTIKSADISSRKIPIFPTVVKIQRNTEVINASVFGYSFN